MEQRLRVLVGVLLAGALVNVYGRAQQTRCPQDKRSGADATQFKVSIGALTMPVGALLLVRNGSQLGAIRITSVEPAAKYEGKSNYESFFLPDKTTSFAGSGVDHQTGDIYIGETVGVHAVYVHTKGHYRTKSGPWTFWFPFPTTIDMSPATFWKGPHDQGFEFAPTSACEVSQIDVTDKRLRWFRWDKTTQVDLPLAELPK